MLRCNKNNAFDRIFFDPCVNLQLITQIIFNIINMMRILEINRHADIRTALWYVCFDFNVHEWAAPEFLEQVAKEVLEERWQKVTTDKLPEAASLRIGQPTSQQSEKVIC
ncbi:hypothetical protein [Desulfosarcina sp.]|uniref:hypothetical protein n=1 Tax=Desulfosarcina sp. TaxID=2027861 RepID=UPI0029AB8767|nr:hypothetical protein [Desulfosarcina sp.]MDX2451967.1 hypothetical protein [Desulfosarcina sp.]MDX2489751.1 hypothetical protein [Desulfosarcina sp.]